MCTYSSLLTVCQRALLHVSMTMDVSPTNNLYLKMKKKTFLIRVVKKLLQYNFNSLKSYCKKVFTIQCRKAFLFHLELKICIWWYLRCHRYMMQCALVYYDTVNKLGYEPHRHVVSILFCFSFDLVNVCESFVEVVLKGSSIVLNRILIQVVAFPVTFL